MEPTSQIPECEETKCEEPRQVIASTYCPVTIFFIVPKGIDLNNKEQVVNHWVKYGVLFIELTDGKTIQVQAFFEPEPDYKWPDKTVISDSNTENLDVEDYEDPEPNYDSD